MNPSYSSPFDGIFYDFEEGAKSPFKAWYYTKKIYAGGKPKSVPVRRRFENEEARDVWATSIDAQKRNLGESTQALDPARLKRWEIADALLEGHDPVMVAREWLLAKKREAAVVVVEMTAGEVVDRYWSHRVKDPKFRPSSYRKPLERFKEVFGDSFLSGLEDRSHEFYQWIQDLPFGDFAKRNHFTRIKGAFSWAAKSKLIARDPLAGLSKPKVRRKDIEYLGVDDVGLLYAANFHLPGVCAKIALGMQGGMRTSAVARVEWKDLQLSRRAVVTPGWKTKKDRRQFMEGLPDVVWQWVVRAKAEDFAKPCRATGEAEREDWKKSVGAKWMHEKEKALARAGLYVPKVTAPPTNWARHSFATYHMAAYDNAPLTSKLMSHLVSVEVLLESYKGEASKSEGMAFLDVGPERFEDGGDLRYLVERFEEE